MGFHMLENEYEITSLQVLAETEERASKKKAVALFDDGTLNTLEAGKFASLQIIHRVLFEDIYDFARLRPGLRQVQLEDPVDRLDGTRLVARLRRMVHPVRPPRVHRPRRVPVQTDFAQIAIRGRGVEHLEGRLPAEVGEHTGSFPRTLLHQ